MLYLGIDQHRKQLTVNIRDEQGDVVLKRQVSTEWDRVRKFFEELRERAEPEGGFLAIVEICGFNDWLLEMLKEYGCRETVLIQPEKRSRKKTDRRDASVLSQLLWVNRQRVLGGKRVQGLKRIILPSQEEQDNRQLTCLYGSARHPADPDHQQGAAHSLEAQPATGMPDEGDEDEKGSPVVDRIVLGGSGPAGDGPVAGPVGVVGRTDCEDRREDSRAAAEAQDGPDRGDAAGCQRLQQSGLGLADRRDRELPASGQPGQLLGPDAWLPQLGRCHRSTGLDHQGGKCDGAIHSGATGRPRVAARCVDESVVCGIKKRRGSKIARVAVMRRLATIIWHMVKNNEPYCMGGPPKKRLQKAA